MPTPGSASYLLLSRLMYRECVDHSRGTGYDQTTYIWWATAVMAFLGGILCRNTPTTSFQHIFRFHSIHKIMHTTYTCILFVFCTCRFCPYPSWWLNWRQSVKQPLVCGKVNYMIRSCAKATTIQGEKNMPIFMGYAVHVGFWPRFNIKMSSYWYRKSHCGDKTVVRWHIYIESGPWFSATYLSSFSGLPSESGAIYFLYNYFISNTRITA